MPVMHGTPLASAWLALVALGGCASKGDLRRVEEQLLLSRAENQRADSATGRPTGRDHRDAAADHGFAGRDRSAASGPGEHASCGTLKGDVANDLISMQQQLVQVQALTGQSQQRLTELQTQLEARSEQLNAAPAAPDTAGPAAPRRGPSRGIAFRRADVRRLAAAASARQSRDRADGIPRIAPAVSRPMPRVPDATYFLGETFAAEAPDSAVVYYGKVVESFPQSPRAASALYKLGLLAERRKDLEGARGYYQRVVRDYPRSDEAALARDRLKTLGR